MPGPIGSCAKKFGEPSTNLIRRRHWDSEQYDAAFPSGCRPARQFSKILVESQQDTLFACRPSEHFGILHAARQIPYPDNIVTGACKGDYGGAREILICEKSHPQAAGKTLSELRTSRA